MTQQMREDIFHVYRELSGESGQEYLMVIATEYPQLFCNFLLKLIPQEIKAEIGRPGEFDHMTNEELKSTALAKLLTALPEEELEKIGPTLQRLQGTGSGAEDDGGIEVTGSVRTPDRLHGSDLALLPDGTPPPENNGSTGEG